MRCMACGAAMHLIEVQPAEATMGPGFEHHTFECSDCKDVERRLMFSSPSVQPQPVPAHPAASSAATAARGGEADSDHALLRNAWEMLRGWRKGA
jgi:hypothetical protein